jgi:hypothetical protein
MNYMAIQIFDIDSMPRGGPDASWLDRWLQTDRPEYLDRADVDDLKRTVVRSLDYLGRLFGNHHAFARIALGEVADVSGPKILELGSGHGGLSRALVESHPTVEVTVTDIERESVAAIAAGDLGSHPRVTVREMARPPSTRPMDSTTLPYSHFPSTTYRRRSPPECSPKAPAPPASC